MTGAARLVLGLLGELQVVAQAANKMATSSRPKIRLWPTADRYMHRSYQIGVFSRVLIFVEQLAH